MNLVGWGKGLDEEVAGNLQLDPGGWSRKSGWQCPERNPWEHSSIQVSKTQHPHLPSQHLGPRGRQIAVSLKPSWSTLQVPGQPELHNETLSQTTTTK